MASGCEMVAGGVLATESGSRRRSVQVRRRSGGGAAEARLRSFVGLGPGFGIQKLKNFGACRIGRISEIFEISGRISVELTSQTI